MYENIFKSLEHPVLYKETEVAFWDDEHISKQMLKNHIDPENDGASRKLVFIEKSVNWIKGIVPPNEYQTLLDIGCGPGIYAEKFTQAGYFVTGVDFSKRSINYAKKSAQEKEANIDYLYQNYLNLNLDKCFDFATMIYCDYGALSDKNRQKILCNVYQHLKPGGKFLLDVFSMTAYNDFKEQQTWEFHRNGGFWRKNEYIALNRYSKFSESVTLDQIAIISNDIITNYYLWNSYFTKENLIKEISESGFKVCKIFGDVSGSDYSKESTTIAILLEK